MRSARVIAIAALMLAPLSSCADGQRSENDQPATSPSPNDSGLPVPSSTEAAPAIDVEDDAAAVVIQPSEQPDLTDATLVPTALSGPAELTVTGDQRLQWATGSDGSITIDPANGSMTTENLGPEAPLIEESLVPASATFIADLVASVGQFHHGDPVRWDDASLPIERRLSVNPAGAVSVEVNREGSGGTEFGFCGEECGPVDLMLAVLDQGDHVAIGLLQAGARDVRSLDGSVELLQDPVLKRLWYQLRVPDAVIEPSLEVVWDDGTESQHQLPLQHFLPGG